MTSIAATEKGGKIISDLQGSKFGYNVKETKDVENSGFTFDSKKKAGGEIAYSRKGGFADGVSMKINFVLGHEIMHAWATEFTNENKENGNVNRLNRELTGVEFENYL